MPFLDYRPYRFGHGKSIARFHRSTEWRGYLQQIGRSLVVRDVDTWLVESCGIEKHGIAFSQLELNHVLFEVVNVSWLSNGCVPFVKQLRERHETCGTGRQWHIGMSNGRLQRQKLRSDLVDQRDPLDSIHRLMADIFASATHQTEAYGNPGEYPVGCPL